MEITKEKLEQALLEVADVIRDDISGYPERAWGELLGASELLLKLGLGVYGTYLSSKVEGTSIVDVELKRVEL